MATGSTKETHIPSSNSSFLKRELNGASFLTLEHIAHMLLVVIVATLLAVGIVSTLSMWTGIPGVSSIVAGSTSVYLVGGATKAFEASIALGIVAALLVLVPALIVLDRRTRAEWRKRSGYAGRLAYKAPIYTALGVLGALKVATFIKMIYIVLASLAVLGLQNAPIGSMYLDSFLPAAIALVVYAVSAWYVFKLVKGRDNGSLYSMAVGVLGVAVVVSLFVTSVTILHSGNNSFAPGGIIEPIRPSAPTYYNSSKEYQDLLEQLDRP